MAMRTVELPAGPVGGTGTQRPRFDAARTPVMLTVSSLVLVGSLLVGCIAAAGGGHPRPEPGAEVSSPPGIAPGLPVPVPAPPPALP